MQAPCAARMQARTSHCFCTGQSNPYILCKLTLVAFVQYVSLWRGYSCIALRLSLAPPLDLVSVGADVHKALQRNGSKEVHSQL